MNLTIVCWTTPVNWARLDFKMLESVNSTRLKWTKTTVHFPDLTQTQLSCSRWTTQHDVLCKSWACLSHTALQLGPHSPQLPITRRQGESQNDGTSRTATARAVNCFKWCDRFCDWALLTVTEAETETGWLRATGDLMCQHQHRSACLILSHVVAGVSLPDLLLPYLQHMVKCPLSSVAVWGIVAGEMA